MVRAIDIDVTEGRRNRSRARSRVENFIGDVDAELGDGFVAVDREDGVFVSEVVVVCRQLRRSELEAGCRLFKKILDTIR